MSIEDIETEFTKVNSRLEAEAVLKQVGIPTMSKNPGEIMLIAAQSGFINVIRFYESGMYPITFQNQFGDSLLHFACRGNQVKVVYYLLKRGLKVTVQNKFYETPLFAAAESGSVDIMTLLCQNKDLKIDH